MPELQTFETLFCDYNLYCNFDAKTEVWHWSDEAIGLLVADDEDSVNILVKYNPQLDPNFGL